MKERPQQIWVSPRFYEHLNQRVIRNKPLVKKLKRSNPNLDVYSSFQEASDAIYDNFLKNEPRRRGRKRK